MKRLLQLVLILATAGSAQVASASWTVVQHKFGSCGSGCSTSSPITLTVSGLSSTGGSHTIILLANLYETGTGTITAAWSSCTDGKSSSYSHNSATDYTGYAYSASNYVSSLACYTTSSIAGATTASMTITMGGTLSSTAWSIEAIELSWSGSTMAYDTGGATDDTTSQANQPGIGLTIGGSSDVICQSINAGGAGSMAGTPISGGAGYTSAFTPDVDNTYGAAAYACALNTTTGTAPTWAQGAAGKVTVNAIAIGGSGGGNAYTATPSETNTASDAGIARTAGFHRADSETNAASDGGVTRLATLARSESETNAVSDAGIVRTLAAQRGPSETNTASDSTPTRVATLARGDSETNTASDALSALRNSHPYSASMAETNAASDGGVTRLATLARGESETNAASDGGITRLASWLRADSETNTASDSVGAVHNSGPHAYSATPSETNTAGDSMARVEAAWRGNVIVLSWLPPPGAGGNSSYTYNLYRSTTEGAEGPSAPSTLIASGIDAGCSTQASCTYLDYRIQAGTEYYYEVTVVYQSNESLVSNETGIVAAPNVVLEADSTSDSLGRQAGFSRADSETNTASDALARLGHFGRGDSETNTASDLLSARKPTGNVYNAVMNEALSLSDALSRLSAYLRGSSETNTTSDVLGRLAASYRQAAEMAAFSDVVAGVWTRSLGIPVQPRHAGRVPGKTKTGEAPVH